MRKRFSKTVELEVDFNQIIASSPINELLFLKEQIEAKLRELKDGPRVLLPQIVPLAERDPSKHKYWNKIHFVKLVRDVTYLGLKDAKDAVEASRPVQCYGEGSRDKLVKQLRLWRDDGLVSYDHLPETLLHSYGVIKDMNE